MEAKLYPHCSNYANIHEFPTVSKPKKVGCFSVDKDRQFVPDRSNLMYVHLPKSDTKFQYDLNKGFECMVPKPEGDEKLDLILRFILKNADQLKKYSELNSNDYIKHDFVSFRGLLRMLMCTPYENRENWTVLVTKWKNTIYLCNLDTEEKKQNNENKTQQDHKFCYWGFKFEQYVMSPDLTTEPETESPVVLANEFCAMNETKIENNLLLYCAEMDGILSETPVDRSVDLNTLEFIELKTKRREQNFRQMNNFYKYKSIKWWCQSFLVGIEKIFVGVRNDHGIVDEIQEMLVSDIPKRSKEFWSPSVCMKFLVDFLDMVKVDTKHLNSPYTVYKYDYNPLKGRRIMRSQFEGHNQHSFLPKWYVDKVDPDVKNL